MKITLQASNFVFNPTAKTLNFDNMGGQFFPERLLAVINVTTGALIYATASAPTYGGTFSNGVYTKSVLTYTSSNVGQSSSDIIEVLYDSETAYQNVTGQVTSQTLDSSGNGIGSVYDVSGGNKLKTASNTYAGDGTPILSTVDPISGSDGLNTHLQSSSFGGQIGNPIPIPNNLNALSVGFLNGSTGTLATPKMDPVTNELIVQANFAAAATQDVNLTQVNGSPFSSLPVDIISQSGPNLETNINVGGLAPATNLGANSTTSLRTSSNLALNGTNVSASLGSNDAGTIRTASNVAFNGVAATTQNGVVTTGTQRVVLATDQPEVPTNLTKVGGGALSFGQKSMSLSVPVVIASDQTAVNTTLPDLFITGQASQSALINNIIPSTAGATATDLSGYRAGHVQIVCSAGISAGAFVFEASNDNANFQSIPVLNQSLITGAATSGAISTLANTQIIYAFPITARYLRLRISTAVVGGTIQAFSRFTQAAYTPAITSVAQPTAAQLNATITGSLTSAGTVTQAAAASLNCTAVVAGATLAASVTSDITAASVTATGVSATITPTNSHSAAFALVVTVTSGSGTLDVTLQEALDGTASPTLWENIYSFERITTATRIYIPAMRLSGTNLRLNYTVSGTVNYAVTLLRTTRQVSAPLIRRLMDRAIVPATLNSTSGALWVDGSESFDMIVSMSAGGTAPVIQLQGSEDSSNWYNIGSALTAAVGATTALNVSDGSQPKWIRAQITTAGATSALNYLALKGKSSG